MRAPLSYEICSDLSWQQQETNTVVFLLSLHFLFSVTSLSSVPILSGVPGLFFTTGLSLSVGVETFSLLLKATPW